MEPTPEGRGCRCGGRGFETSRPDDAGPPPRPFSFPAYGANSPFQPVTAALLVAGEVGTRRVVTQSRATVRNELFLPHQGREEEWGDVGLGTKEGPDGVRTRLLHPVRPYRPLGPVPPRRDQLPSIPPLLPPRVSVQSALPARSGTTHPRPRPPGDFRVCRPSRSLIPPRSCLPILTYRPRSPLLYDPGVLSPRHRVGPHRVPRAPVRREKRRKGVWEWEGWRVWSVSRTRVPQDGRRWKGSRVQSSTGDDDVGFPGRNPPPPGKYPTSVPVGRRPGGEGSGVRRDGPWGRRVTKSLVA